MTPFSAKFMAVDSIKVCSNHYKELDTRGFLRNKRGCGIYRTHAVLGHRKPFVEHILWSSADFNDRRQRSSMRKSIDWASIFLGYSSGSEDLE